MKTIKGIIRQKPVFLNNFDSQESVFGNFEITAIEGIKVLFASYGGACYEGDAWVLFSKDQKLYEVSGSHCSCHGLEGQWEPEEVNLEELKNRLIKRTFGGSSDHFFRPQLIDFLGIK